MIGFSERYFLQQDGASFSWAGCFLGSIVLYVALDSLLFNVEAISLWWRWILIFSMALGPLLAAVVASCGLSQVAFGGLKADVFFKLAGPLSFVIYLSSYGLSYQLQDAKEVVATANPGLAIPLMLQTLGSALYSGMLCVVVVALSVLVFELPVLWWQQEKARQVNVANLLASLRPHVVLLLVGLLISLIVGMLAAELSPLEIQSRITGG